MPDPKTERLFPAFDKNKCAQENSTTQVEYKYNGSFSSRDTICPLDPLPIYAGITGPELKASNPDHVTHRCFIISNVHELA